MSDQYIRKAGLFVTSPNSTVINLSELQFKFQTTQGDVQTPNSLDVTIYNMKADTVSKIKKEFTRVTLQAGYETGNYGVIFDGSIVQTRAGRENATDTYLNILASDGDTAYNFATINKTLARGSTPKDQVDAMKGSFNEQGLEDGYQAPMTGGILPRGKVLYGMTRDPMRELTQSQSMAWSMQNGKLQIVPVKGYAPGQAVVLTAATGMIGLPEQTNDGIRVRTLLNPLVSLRGLVKIDNKSIQQAQFSLNIQDQVQNYLFATVADDGLYAVYVIEHLGDTRDNDWYSDLTCLSVDPSVPAAQSIKEFG